MKTSNRLKVARLIILLASVPGVLRADNYKIEWSTLDSGGHRLQNGSGYVLEGTIGQPDAGGTAQQDSHHVSGGFWHRLVKVVLTDNAPELKIHRSGKDEIVLSWSDPTGEWELQESSDLKEESWDTSSLITIQQGDDTAIELSEAAGMRYFRLRKPE